MRLLAIDPGPEESAYFLLVDGKPANFGKFSNDAILRMIHARDLLADFLVIEKIASFGMPVGAEVFETVYWSGIFAHAFGLDRVDRLTRIAVKNHLCHSSRAKDGNIRQAIIDRLGPIGTKKSPGPCYGISGDVWSALAVALTWSDLHR
jgi:hypothetical protein